MDWYWVTPLGDLIRNVGFPIVATIFLFIGVWKSTKFLGIRLFGDNGYLTDLLKTLNETQKSQSKQLETIANATEQTASSVEGMRLLIERETGNRQHVDKKLTSFIDEQKHSIRTEEKIREGNIVK